MGQIADHGFHAAAVARELLGGHGKQLPGRTVVWISAAAEGVQVCHGPAPQLGAEILPFQSKVAELTGHQSGLEHAVQLQAKLVGSGPGGPLDAAVVAQHQNGIPGYIIQGGGEFWVNQGHIPVRGGVVQAVLVFLQVLGQGGYQGLIYRLSPALPGNHGLQIVAKAVDSLGMAVGQRFADRQQHAGIGVFLPPLGARVKVAHGVQLIPKELNPDGLFGGGGEDVQNAAPQGKLPHALHHAAAAVSGGNQPGEQILYFVFFPGFQGNHCF